MRFAFFVDLISPPAAKGSATLWNPMLVKEINYKIVSLKINFGIKNDTIKKSFK